MLSRPGPERAIAIAVVLARTAVCAYRAATQSFTQDEAYTFGNFVVGPWRDLYFKYEANNHVLYSILSRLSKVLFGDSEFALRLPSVAAGFFLMLAVWLILERVDSRPVRWVAFLAIGLHPLLLDLSVAARGYGLAAAFLAWAVYAAMAGRSVAAGSLLGLAVAGNLTVAFPAMGLGAACFLLQERAWAGKARTAIAMALPAAAVVLILLGGSLRRMSLDKFYVGLPTFRDSLFNLIYVSIQAAPASSHRGLFGTRFAASGIEYGVLPVIALLILGGSILAWRRGDRRSPMAPLALAVAAFGMVAAHWLTGVLYPVDRTGISFLLLFGLAWAMAAGAAEKRPLRGVHLLVGGLLAIQFATQFHVWSFYNWTYDRSTKEIARRIEEEIRGKPPASISIGASWVHRWTLEYYRLHYRVEALQPVALADPPEVTGHDYYLLNQSCWLPPPKVSTAAGELRNFAAAYEHGVLFSDPGAAVILATEAGSSRPAFFAGEKALDNGVYYLRFPSNGTEFGSYSYQSFSWIYHADLGLECAVDVHDGGGMKLYDSASGHSFYTSSSNFPYLYDFTLGAWLYYFPDTKKPGHYTTNPRRFVNMTTKEVFTM